MVHSDNAWARRQLENNIDDVRQRMLEALEKLMGDSLPRPDHIAIHLWEYAKAEKSWEESFLLDESNGLAACGDWCGGNRVEDAYLSGLNLGEHLQTLWRRET